MSITDELREYALGWDERNRIRGDLEAIADRIDAEHEAALLNVHIDLMDASGWVRLPKDADGEYIHIGDVMDGVDKYDSLKNVTGKVITVSFESDGIVDVAIQAWNSDGKSWHRAYLDPYASVCRHYHAPTVEDVLREMHMKLDEVTALYVGEAIDSDERDRDEARIFAEYAKRLTLAEGEDA